jgi:hypothetical protein
MAQGLSSLPVPNKPSRICDCLSGNDFINRQKLNQLKSQVIPESEVDDPFITNPIGIERVADYRGGMLSFELSASPPPNWIMAFRGLGNYAAIIGSEPQPISSESVAQIAVNHAKNYAQQANVAIL